MGVKPAGTTVLVAHCLGRHDALPGADPADPAHPLLAAEDLLLDLQPLFAILIYDELGGPRSRNPGSM